MPFDGSQLRAKRKAMQDHGRPISQQRFAELAGYSKRTQERYETNKSEPRLAHLERIIELTGETQAFFYRPNGSRADGDGPNAADDQEADLAMREAFALFVDLQDALARRLVRAEAGTA